MMCISYAASDKMAISHSNHMFVSLAFVFCLLSSLARVSDSYDYTDSRLLGKKLAVSKHRNNTQRLPNYSWKPPDKYHGPRKESTEKKAGMEFTKPEDPEQSVADPRIKKMQEIRRQEREKWAGHKRNENGELVLDNVEETTKASELRSDESITMSVLPENTESNGNGKEDSGTSEDLLQRSEKSPNETIDASTERKLAHHPPVHQSNASVKASQNSSELNPSQSTSASSSNEKFSSHRWGISVRKPPAGFLRDAYAAHQRDKNNKKVSGKKREPEKNRLLGSAADSHSEQQPTSRRSKGRNSPKRHKSSHGNLEKIPKERRSHRPQEHPVKEHLRQSGPPRDDSEEGSENCDEEEEEGDEKDDGERVVTASSLTRKSEEEETDDTRGKVVIEKPLNHRRSFQPGRWGMSVSSPPAEFLRNVSRRGMHRKTKEHTGGKKEDGRVHRTDRWDVSVSFPPGKEFLEDIPLKPPRAGEGHGRSTVKTRSRLGEVKGSSGDRSPASQRRPDLRTNLTQQSMTDERGNEELASDAFGKAPGDPDRPADRRESDRGARQASVDFNNNPFPRSTILFREIVASWSNIDFGSDSAADMPAPYRGRVRFFHLPLK
ncbi:uncharacterized protein LOC116848415 [Odontomachus brunneus]|uniref:uncharacterized protein LOC116848415 n=1 Tax=Odontomachus brunneus TaxID=486640 RepID=UPI0013F1E860|nr:uncharacterized protein LOC116848415 [Odontomachus brunneus]